jgi:hypothetical protein
MTDLNDCLWYHGKLVLNTSELNKLFKNNGDFLVRNSLHQSNQYTLSVFYNHKIQHFRINQLLDENTKEKHYLFDNENIIFKSIKELIDYYLNNSLEITKLSALLIKTPVLRSKSIIPVIIIDENENYINNNDESSNYYELFTPIEQEKRKKSVLLLNTLKNRSILSSASSENNLNESSDQQPMKLNNSQDNISRIKGKLIKLFEME